ncbi:hypothetical protein Slin15195_G082660 [Septoria linicola]|uniref:Uncharacterized protein n=1 Tax=Septoria linicola TaxID=215465 RepID=A0A9Q9ELY7_9PEZI|nr:hypothetical protein Slin14017_G130760 [Septoria linicola]USW54947.1 hypothetical protein Slin15195_G082660 [Septoria linicola]
MASSVPPLAKSESKARFFSRLGLSRSESKHRRVYHLMKVRLSRSDQDRIFLIPQQLETIDGRERIIKKIRIRRASTNAAHGYESTTYTTAEVDEDLIMEEIRRIYKDASLLTKPFYDLAVDTTTSDDSNWIIRWMIWHVFRYRDGRYCSAGRRSTGLTSVSQDRSKSPMLMDCRHRPVDLLKDSISRDTGYFDPVRDRYQSSKRD